MYFKTKKKSFIRIGVVLLVVAMLASTLAGCMQKSTSKDNGKGNEPAQKTSDPSKPASWISDKPLEISMMWFDEAAYPFNKDWLLLKEITKRTNVTINANVTNTKDWVQKRNVLLSTGDAPDIIPRTSVGQEDDFAASGALLPIGDYLDLLPNFKEKIKKWGVEDEVFQYKQKDGKLYILPGLKEVEINDRWIAIRTDILKKHNLAVPKTFDDLYVTAKKLKEHYPDSIPWTEKQKMQLNLRIIGAAFDIRGGNQIGDGVIFDWDKKDFFFFPTTDKQKDMLKYMNKLVSEGLFDKESFTQSNEQCHQKLTTNKSFITSLNFSGVGDLNSNGRKSVGPDFTLELVPLVGPYGKNTVSSSRVSDGLMFPASVKNKPYFKELLKFADWLFYSDEGLTLTRWGVEGVTFKVVNGKKQLMDDVRYRTVNPTASKQLEKEYGVSASMFNQTIVAETEYGFMQEADAKFSTDFAKIAKLVPPNPPLRRSPEEQENFTLLSTTLKDYVEQNITKFILGNLSVEKDWDAYVKGCKDKGSEKLVELSRTVYKRQNGK